MSQKKEISFEKSIERLERIVDEMENGSPDLEKSLELFKEGMELARECRSKIMDAKRKIEILIVKGLDVSREDFKG
ncbi:MAG: exodeoxyribonuclease VII small subunit [Elusimicrobiota bacterium]|jgi:exodeoxyribonuclease VII small subunit|nr:exodeoxyribonuclease VII small subunit [Elusimicrobiota bacterium]